MIDNHHLLSIISTLKQKLKVVRMEFETLYKFIRMLINHTNVMQHVLHAKTHALRKAHDHVTSNTLL